MTKVKKLLNSIDAIITKRSQAIVIGVIEEYKKIYLDTLRAWKTEVRMLLSKPHIPGTTNKTLWPKLRSGMLRKSLSYRSSMIIRKKSPRSVLYRVTINWDKDPQTGNPNHKGPTGVDYGELLNSSNRFANSTFFGWKDRTYELLQKRIKQNLR